MTSHVKCPATMHISLVMGLLEALLAAWIEIGDLCTSVLQNYPNRLDVLAFLNFFEPLMLVMLQYQGFLKSNNENLFYGVGIPYAIKQALSTQRPNYTPLLIRQDNHYNFLKETQHPLFVQCSELLYLNEEFGEKAINLIAKKEMRTVQCSGRCRSYYKAKVCSSS